ncbi:phosphatidate cytidylyltransferase [Paucidesulfovibrio gracilis DSM 16080]|uniref:Phosphatidate cytidylyltransferase n=1 Tax=Paucidesulfovibrio gracilis DSM 16080 TaxID=1121449 RepID=A0A1T4WD45_9BACT|nr:phosphatidate cytidylyltransferase [Paucidesulfovibrio gracilis]SKA74948.1 phosphatidate cytidylyltransferase [Paucidesulfovibrio gracilis DSM 16080]
MPVNTHQQRIITGLLALTIPAAGIFCGGWVLLTVLLIFCGLTLWEFYALFWTQGHLRLRSAGLVCAGLLFWAAVLRDPTWIIFALLVSFWTGGLAFLFRFQTQREIPARDAMVFLFGLVYLPLTLHFPLLWNSMEIVLVLLAAMAGDTAAYYAGSLWGRKKIWPAVSPKKSWVGSIAGMSATMALTVLLGLAFGNAPLWAFALLGAVLNMAGQLGDFFESALKRGLGIKDSGTILPGHGGMLDRVDSLLFIIPVYALARECAPLLILGNHFTPLLSPVTGS